jgi:hypothetical protein
MVAKWAGQTAYNSVDLLAERMVGTLAEH